MTLPRHVIVLIVFLTLVGACVGPGSHAGIGAGTSVGSAYVPVGTSSGTTTTLSYHESGGFVSRGLLAILAGLASAPRTSSTVQVSDSISCSGGSCSITRTTTTTTTVLDTPEQLQAKAERFNGMMKTLSTSDIPVDFRFDLATRSLGGDTSGWLATMMFKATPVVADHAVVQFSMGLGAGSLSFHDRTATRLVNTGTALQEQEQAMSNPGYGYLGVPVRLEAAVGSSGALLFTQADLNILSLTDSVFGDEGSSIRPSPLHVGGGFRVGPLKLLGDLVVGRFRQDGLTATVEASLVL